MKEKTSFLKLIWTSKIDSNNHICLQSHVTEQKSQGGKKHTHKTKQESKKTTHKPINTDDYYMY